MNEEQMKQNNVFIDYKLEKTNNNLSGKIEFKDGNRNKYVFEFANLFLQ